MQTVSDSEARAFYTASLAALRYLEAERPTGRRFGPDADARWKAFEGDLKAIDRIDLLIRDADAQWARSFGARTVFDFGEVAEDEAFGPSWPRLDPVEAAALWRASEEVAPRSLFEALQAAAGAWGLALERIALEAPVAPGDKLLLVGPSAIASVAQAFAEGADLDWSEQIVCVASPPAHRQLAALSGALLNAPRACRLLSEPGPSLASHRLVASPDAQPSDRALANELVGG
jgi:hypothetical protein